MPAAQHTNATIQIHVAVLLFGFTAILGDLIDMCDYDCLVARLDYKYQPMDAHRIREDAS